MSGLEYGAPVVGGIRFRGFAASTGHAIKSFEHAQPRYLSGVACRFDKVHLYKGNYDVFQPGCFAKTLLKSETVRFLLGHDEAKLVATTNGGGLELLSDGAGLSFSVTLPNTALAAQLYDDVKSGRQRQMSIGYVAEESHDRIIDGTKLRIITAARLNEISVVKHAAVPHTFVEVSKSRPSLTTKSRSEADMLALFADIQAGLSRLSEACG